MKNAHLVIFNTNYSRCEMLDCILFSFTSSGKTRKNIVDSKGGHCKMLPSCESCKNGAQKVVVEQAIQFSKMIDGGH